MKEIQGRLDGKFDGKIGWYYTIVKLNTKARSEIVRRSGTGNQRIKLA